MKNINDIHEETGLNNLPENQKQKVWNLAWGYGHSSGYYSVYGYLVDLINLFK